MSPITLFNEWYTAETKLNGGGIPGACCLSTTGIDGYPNARYVCLKDVIEDAFLITGSLTSRKGLELQYNNKAALVFWWPFTKKQIRIQGDVRFISTLESDRYFQNSTRMAQLMSLVSEQGEEIHHPEILEIKYHQADNEFKDKPIPRPLNWGGFLLKPRSMEFLSLKKTGFHQRILFTRVQHLWETKMLQP